MVSVPSSDGRRTVIVTPGAWWRPRSVDDCREAILNVIDDDCCRCYFSLWWSSEVALTSSMTSATVVVADGSGASIAVGDVDELEQLTLLSTRKYNSNVIKERWGRFKLAIFSAR